MYNVENAYIVSILSIEHDIGARIVVYNVYQNFAGVMFLAWAEDRSFY